jgi:nucleotide-binding universal stress UspA family protein
MFDDRRGDPAADRLTQLTTDARTIVSYTHEDDRHREVREVAMNAARRSGAALILYALESYTPLADPLPNDTWSGEGQRRLFGNPLSIGDLEQLGRSQLAAQVLAASQGGVDAGAWIPEKPGIDALVAYAQQHDADLVLLPESIVDADLLERLQGVSVDEAAEADRRRGVEVLFVTPQRAVLHPDEARQEATR